MIKLFRNLLAARLPDRQGKAGIRKKPIEEIYNLINFSVEVDNLYIITKLKPL